MLVRFVAAALVGATLVDLTLYWVVAQHNQTGLSILSCAVKSIPAVIGVILFVREKPVAAWISDKLG